MNSLLIGSIDACQKYYNDYNNVINGFNCTKESPFCCGRCTFRYCCSSIFNQLNQANCPNQQIKNNLNPFTWILVFILIIGFLLLIIKCVINVKKGMLERQNSNRVMFQNEQRLDSNPGHCHDCVNGRCNVHSNDIRIALIDDLYSKTFKNQDLPPSYESLTSTRNERTSMTPVEDTNSL